MNATKDDDGHDTSYVQDRVAASIVRAEIHREKRRGCVCVLQIL